MFIIKFHMQRARVIKMIKMDLNQQLVDLANKEIVQMQL